MVFSVTLLFSMGTFAQKVDCNKMTDDEIVQAIYDKIKVKYGDQIEHINVRVRDKVVTLEGWTTTEKVKKEIEGYAKKIKCINCVVNKLTIGIGGGCGPGTKPCGSICIPESERCNIRG